MNGRIFGDIIGRCRTAFLCSVSIVLLLTAFAKVVSLVQDKPFLHMHDPVVSNVDVSVSLGIAALLEVLVACYILWRLKSESALVALSLLTSLFVSYRAFKWASFAVEPCHCMGGILDWTGTPQEILKNVPVIILWYMGIGSVFFLGAACWREKYIAGKQMHWLGLAAFLMALIPPKSASAQDQTLDGVQACGVLTTLNFSSDGKVIAKWSDTNAFRVNLMRDGRYAITAESTEQTNSVCFAYDGRDLYSVLNSSEPLGVGQRTSPKSRVSQGRIANSMGYVSGENYPHAPFDEFLRRIPDLWLVYGSGTYFKSLKTNTIPLPWVRARSQLGAFGFRLETDLLSAPLFLPRQVHFVRDSRLDLPEDQEVARPELGQFNDSALPVMLRDLRRRKEIKDGYVRAELEVLQATNYQGLELPVSFTIKTYLPTGNGPKHQAVGYVTNLTGIVSNSFSLPPIVREMPVFDDRFRLEPRSVDVMLYGMKPEQKWEAKESSRMQRIYQDNLKGRMTSSRSMPETLRRRRMTISWMICVLATGIPVLFYVRIRRLRNRGTGEPSSRGETRIEKK